MALGTDDVQSTGVEDSVVALLDSHGVAAVARPDAPGVYVNEAKVAALGLRVRKGCSYHGLSVNVDMDLTPFSLINPCGYEGLAVTMQRDLGVRLTLDETADALVELLRVALGYTATIHASDEDVPAGSELPNGENVDLLPSRDLHE